MNKTSVLGWIKKISWHLPAILAMVASAYAMDRWFISGLTASKWIGLPQYASAMKEFQNVSRTWGSRAVILECVAFVLLLPAWQKQKVVPMKDSMFLVTTNPNARLEFLGRCVLRAALCFLGTLALAILILVIANFFGAMLHAK